ncbi:MAG: hypothetical protein LBK66_12885 [Spirochaetaceae bacterium]|nr:hypothetical protein [Spirochaetaceae bacterium]
MSLSGTGRLIQTAATQTFIIDGPTLQGISGNNTSLVYIADNSAVELRSGYIKGNTRSSFASVGGGVYVRYSSNFTMTGGEISGNTAADLAGGVFILNGNFKMTGGGISSNNTGGAGGGVYIYNGNFSMTGGFIYGSGSGDLSNTAANGSAACIQSAQPSAIDTTITKYPSSP